MNKKSLLSFFLTVFIGFSTTVQVQAIPSLFSDGCSIPRFADQNMGEHISDLMQDTQTESGTLTAISNAISDGVKGGLTSVWTWLRPQAQTTVTNAITDALNNQHEPAQKLVCNGVFYGLLKASPLIVGAIGTAYAFHSLTNWAKAKDPEERKRHLIVSGICATTTAAATAALVACARWAL